MEDNFEQLLENYLDENEINNKINIEKKEEEKELNNHNDLTPLKDYSITILDFLRDYLNSDIDYIEIKKLTHREFKELTKDNPLVIGIYNGYVDIDEVVKGDYLIVTDCFGNIGSYLNPNHLRELTKLEIIKNQLSIMKKIRISILSDLDEYYKKFMEATNEYEYLNQKCSGYMEALKKTKKIGKMKNIQRFVDKYGPDLIDID